MRSAQVRIAVLMHIMRDILIIGTGAIGRAHAAATRCPITNRSASWWWTEPHCLEPFSEASALAPSRIWRRPSPRKWRRCHRGGRRHRSRGQRSVYRLCPGLALLAEKPLVMTIEEADAVVAHADIMQRQITLLACHFLGQFV